MNKYNDRDLDVNLELSVKLPELGKQAALAATHTRAMFEPGAEKRADRISDKMMAEGDIIITETPHEKQEEYESGIGR